MGLEGGGWRGGGVVRSGKEAEYLLQILTGNVGRRRGEGGGGFKVMRDERGGKGGEGAKMCWS